MKNKNVNRSLRINTKSEAEEFIKLLGPAGLRALQTNPFADLQAFNIFLNNWGIASLVD